MRDAAPSSRPARDAGPNPNPSRARTRGAAPVDCKGRRDPPASLRTSPSATDATQAATEPVSGTERTIAASSEISGTEQTVVAPLSGASLPGTDASRGGHPLPPPPPRRGPDDRRRAGDGLRRAFGAVERDRFEPLGELARGGLGRVTRARDPRTGRIVAIKEVLRPTPEMLARASPARRW
ncbi:MAG: hypothetical protein HS111_32880 [Kofleriaceae bacterium]|nr:hypothetical protein [Kofleriaceae bacterium]